MARPITQIGNRYTLELILDIQSNPGISKKDLMYKEASGGDRTKYSRINSLIAQGLVETRSGGRWNTNRLYLTPEGQDVARALNDAESAIVRATEIKKRELAKKEAAEASDAEAPGSEESIDDSSEE